MQYFRIDGMTCAHCERAVTQAVRAVDPAAQVEVDLAAGTMRTDSAASPEALVQAIAVEGYEATIAP